VEVTLCVDTHLYRQEEFVRLPGVQSDDLSGRGAGEGRCVWVMFLEREVPYGRMIENDDEWGKIWKEVVMT
jgi:hypothetical protein